MDRHEWTDKDGHRWYAKAGTIYGAEFGRIETRGDGTPRDEEAYEGDAGASSPLPEPAVEILRLAEENERLRRHGDWLETERVAALEGWRAARVEASKCLTLCEARRAESERLREGQTGDLVQLGADNERARIRRELLELVGEASLDLFDIDRICPE